MHPYPLIAAFASGCRTSGEESGMPERLGPVEALAAGTADFCRDSGFRLLPILPCHAFFILFYSCLKMKAFKVIRNLDRNFSKHIQTYPNTMFGPFGYHVGWFLALQWGCPFESLILAPPALRRNQFHDRCVPDSDSET